jgi:hypothetical protein
MKPPPGAKPRARDEIRPQNEACVHDEIPPMPKSRPVVETTGYNGTKSAFADCEAGPARLI